MAVPATLVAASLGAASLVAASLGAASPVHLLGPIFPRPYIRRINALRIDFTRAFGANWKTTFVDWA